MGTKYTVPALDREKAQRLTALLQNRLTALLDLQLTLKHVHWNVVGPNFIGVHKMLDPQVDRVRKMSDDVAERIATLGAEPMGTPGFVAKNRTWEDYRLARREVEAHLAALDQVYEGVIADHRKGVEESDDLDLVTQEMLIEQSQDLELFQWFLRAHLESATGQLRHEGADTEEQAARAATS